MASPSTDYIAEQPKQVGGMLQPAPQPVLEPDYGQDDDGQVHLPTWKGIKNKFTTKEGWVGDYDFAYLCMPQFPWACGSGSRKRTRSAPFYALDSQLPIFLTLICGLQHALAMLAGLITPPIIFAGQLGFSPAQQTQMVAVSLIASGFLSMVQMTRFPIPFTRRKYWMGTGLVTVVGTSFATLSTASAIFNALYADGTCTSQVIDGVTVRDACPKAYGYLLGTSALCSLLPMLMSFVPPKVLKRIFPPVVTGVVVLLIGAKLVGDSGALAWLGGSGACRSRPTTGPNMTCPTGSHRLPWGSPEYLGLGFLSFMTIIIIEYVGSPAMKSASIIIGLLVGSVIAGPLGYSDASTITNAPAITFLWTETFPLKVYGPAVLPLLAVYLSVGLEVIGDITASSEASRQPVRGPLFESRIQGGLLADGINGMLSGLAMNAPMSIFAQNNGVLSLTRCANRSVGYTCAVILVIFGILAKISGVFLAIPTPVLGGVTTFLFTTVAVAGMKIISTCAFSRRDRVILAASLSLGFATMLVKDFASYIFTYSGSNTALRGFMNSIVIILGTPFLIAGIIASILNATLPADPDAADEQQRPAYVQDHASDSLELGVGPSSSGSARREQDDDVKL
ncbi:nucleobase:cation symporter-2 family protein [Rhodotorula paludigena]|uniref:nucleobase:cation symporter-2 family protein n=1 Tax=Rhodotorula paludigena TaxID=86838 RepID=UPI003181F8F6